jgi:tRNA U34 2-thiouridine synthase MnmA/TrmU
MMNNKIKAIVLVSGGLDSTIVAHMMHRQGLDLICLHFSSPFCTCNSSCGTKNFAKNTADKLDLDFRTKFMGEDFLRVVESPKHGYGKNLNPCIDCRILKFKLAKELMEEENAQFIITGEVAGQRPMSQKVKTMQLIEREAGLEGLVLRPLSANILEPTIPEKKGWVDREKLLSITGRSRKEQYKYVKKFDISSEEYACPGGGCRLTTKEYANKLKDLLVNDKKLILRRVNFLNKGRHFRISEKFKVIVGRDEKENDLLERMAGAEDITMWAKDYNGPLCVGIGRPTEAEIKIMAGICGNYIKYDKDKNIEFIYNSNGTEGSINCTPYTTEQVLALKI